MLIELGLLFVGALRPLDDDIVGSLAQQQYFAIGVFDDDTHSLPL